MSSPKRFFDEVPGVIGRLVVLFAVAIVVAIGLSLALQALVPPESLSVPEEQSILALLLAVGLATGHVVVTLWLERAEWMIAGLDARAFRPVPSLMSLLLGGFAVGVPAGVLLLSGSAALGAGAATGTWGGFAGEAAVLLALGAVAEELVFRGYVIGVLADRWGEGAGLVLTSVAFGALPALDPSFTPLAALSGISAGLMLGVIRLRTGSLPAAMVAHFALNWTQVAVLHAPLRGLPLAAAPGYAWTSSGPAWLTGGTAGLEGSVATAVCLLLVTFLVLRTARPATRRRSRA